MFNARIGADLAWAGLRPSSARRAGTHDPAPAAKPAGFARRLHGPGHSGGPFLPVPSRVTACGLPGALLCTNIVPWATPIPGGAKSAKTSSDPPGEMVAPDTTSHLNGECTGAAAMLTTRSSAPVFLIWVLSCASPLTTVAGKLRFWGTIVISGTLAGTQ